MEALETCATDLYRLAAIAATALRLLKPVEQPRRWCHEAQVKALSEEIDVFLWSKRWYLCGNIGKPLYTYIIYTYIMFKSCTCHALFRWFPVAFGLKLVWKW